MGFHRLVSVFFPGIRLWMLNLRALLGFGFLVTSRPCAASLAQAGSCSVSAAADRYRSHCLSGRAASTMAHGVRHLGWALRECVCWGPGCVRWIWALDSLQAGGGPEDRRGALQWVRLQRGSADGAGRPQLRHGRHTGQNLHRNTQEIQVFSCFRQKVSGFQNKSPSFPPDSTPPSGGISGWRPFYKMDAVLSLLN